LDKSALAIIGLVALILFIIDGITPNDIMRRLELSASFATVCSLFYGFYSLKNISKQNKILEEQTTIMRSEFEFNKQEIERRTVPKFKITYIDVDPPGLFAFKIQNIGAIPTKISEIQIANIPDIVLRSSHPKDIDKIFSFEYKIHNIVIKHQNIDLPHGEVLDVTVYFDDSFENILDDVTLYFIDSIGIKHDLIKESVETIENHPTSPN
jgi:hypothetical protein